MGISGQIALPAHNQALKTRSKKANSATKLPACRAKTADWGSADEEQTRGLACNRPILGSIWFAFSRAFRGPFPLTIRPRIHAQNTASNAAKLPGRRVKQRIGDPRMKRKNAQFSSYRGPFWARFGSRFSGSTGGPSSWQLGVKNALKIALTTRRKFPGDVPAPNFWLPRFKTAVSGAIFVKNGRSKIGSIVS